MISEFVVVQVILEGMGRAIHTNFNARFKCDALKVMFTGFVFHRGNLE